MITLKLREYSHELPAATTTHTHTTSVSERIRLSRLRCRYLSFRANPKNGKQGWTRASQQLREDLEEVGELVRLVACDLKLVTSPSCRKCLKSIGLFAPKRSVEPTCDLQGADVVV